MNQDSSFPPMLPPSSEFGALLFAVLPCLTETYRPLASFAYHMTEQAIPDGRFKGMLAQFKKPYRTQLNQRMVKDMLYVDAVVPIVVFTQTFIAVLLILRNARLIYLNAKYHLF